MCIVENILFNNHIDIEINTQLQTVIFVNLEKNALQSLGEHFSTKLITNKRNYFIASKACSKSALISAMCSIPTEIRSKPGNTPAEILSSGESCS